MATPREVDRTWPRDAPSQPVAAGLAGDARAGRQAAEAVVQAWLATGWPRPPRRGWPHRHVRACLLHYAELRFTPTFDSAQQREIVERALVSFMAHVHLQRRVIDPQSLLAAVDDEALEQWRADSDDVRDRGAEVGSGPGTGGETDEQLTQRLFGADVSPAVVKIALSGLLISRPWAYVLVAQYLDLAHLDGEHVRVREVVARLRTGTGGRNLTCHDVTEAIMDFRARVSALTDERGTPARRAESASGL
jgi:hypothetical protein